MLTTAANRLSAIVSTIMGDAAMKKGEVLLCVLPFPEPKHLWDILNKMFPEMEIIYHQVSLNSQKGLFLEKTVPDEIFHRTTVLATLSALPSKPSLVPNLKFIHFFSAGINHIDKHPIYTDSDITLTTSSGIHGPMISEWVIMQILDNSHKVKRLLGWQKEHHWGSHAAMGEMKDSVGMRFGVLGYGSIGRQAGRVCKAMGMDVIAYTATPRKTPESKNDNGYIVPGTGDPDGSIPSAWYSGLDKESLHNFLSQDIDVLLVSVPLTKETTHLLGTEEFKILGRKNAFVVNISRGSILVQDELVAACKKDPKEGGLRGAALDVTDPEPLPSDNEIWDMKNIAITPHISGLSAAYAERSFQILVRNLNNLKNGEKLINVVDRKKGY